MKNEILSKEELDLYDYVKLRNMIEEIFKLIRYIERTGNKTAIPKITNDYRVRYEQFIPVHSSMVEEFALKNLMLETKTEDKKRKFLSIITTSLRNISNYELEVFNLTFYKYQDEYEIADIIGYNYKKVRKIRKSACIKFLSVLRLDTHCFR